MNRQAVPPGLVSRLIEVQAQDDVWYAVCIPACRTLENVIEDAVIANKKSHRLWRKSL
jgi:hypothetical protein